MRSSATTRSVPVESGRMTTVSVTRSRSSVPDRREDSETSVSARRTSLAEVAWRFEQHPKSTASTIVTIAAFNLIFFFFFT